MVRNVYGHLVNYPGRAVESKNGMNLVYVGTLDGRHEFLINGVIKLNLRSVTLEAALNIFNDLSKEL